MKEKLLKAIVLLMAGVIVFGSTSLIFSAAEVQPEPPTEATSNESSSNESSTKEEPKSEEASSSEVTTTEPTTPPGSTIPIVQFPDRPTTTKAPKKTTTKKASTTKRRTPVNSLETTIVEESSTDIYEDLYADTTAYVWTFADEEVETTEEEKSAFSNFLSKINFGTIALVAVIILAVAGAVVCLIILSKKR